MGNGLMNAVRVILAIVVGAGMAYFWSTLRPNESFEILLGVGIVAMLAAFTSLYFMGKGQG